MNGMIPIRNFLNKAMPNFNNVALNSPYQTMIGGEGFVTFSREVLTGNGATTRNVFTVTQGIVVKKIFGFVSSVTSSAVFQQCSFDANDTATTAAITLAGGGATDCSNAESGALIFRNAPAATALTFLNSNQVRIAEVAAVEPFYPFVLNADNTTTTSVRFNFTGNALTNLTVDFYIQWVPLYSTASVVAA